MLSISESTLHTLMGNRIPSVSVYVYARVLAARDIREDILVVAREGEKKSRRHSSTMNHRGDLASSLADG